MTTETISPDLRTVLRRLKLGRMLDTLPDRFTLARQQKIPHQDFLLLVLGDEASRRDSQAATVRAQRAHLDPALQLEAWDPSAEVTLDQALLNELVSLRFLEARQQPSVPDHQRRHVPGVDETELMRLGIVHRVEESEKASLTLTRR